MPQSIPTSYFDKRVLLQGPFGFLRPRGADHAPPHGFWIWGLASFEKPWGLVRPGVVGSAGPLRGQTIFPSPRGVFFNSFLTFGPGWPY